MKKTIMMCFALLAGVITAIADDVVSVSDTSVPKGAKGTFSINLTNTTTEYTGFEMVLTLPTGVTFSNATLGNRFGDHTVSTNTPYEGNAQQTKIVVSSTTSALITGTSGALLTIEVNVSSDASVGELSGASLTDVKFSTGSLVPLSGVNFSLTITDGIVLDENDTVIPAEQPIGDAFTLNRTIKGGVWNTICLPFTMTGNLAKAKFGDDVKFCSIKSVSDKIDNIITVNFEAVDFDNDEEIEANIPYIIKTTNLYETINFTAEDAIAITPNESSNTISKTKYKFIGTLKAGTIIPADNLFISDNQFWYSDGTNTIKGFRGYFWLRDFSSASASRLLLSIDGETTGIYNISSDTGAFTIEDGKIYNLNGMELDTPTKKGIYIQNGKKIVVK